MQRIKKMILLNFMVIVLVSLCGTIVYAGSSKKTGKLACIIGESPAELPVRAEDNHVWTDARVLTAALGYDVGYREGTIVLRNKDAGKMILFREKSKEVQSLVWLNTVEYQAPFPAMTEDDTLWVPLEFSLLMMDCNLLLDGGQVYISKPQKNIINSLPQLTQNTGRYLFDWERDFGYGNGDEVIIGTASVTANTLNELLKDPTSYVSHVMNQLANAPGSYDDEYAKKLSLLLLSESQSELKATSKSIKEMYKYISPEGKFSKILDSIGTQLDDNVGNWQKICNSLLEGIESENSGTLKYNAAYKQLEKALSRQDAFEKTGGFIHSVQESMPKEVSDTFSAMNVLAKVADFFSYADEFNQQDVFAVSALENFCKHADRKGTVSPVMLESLQRQTDRMQADMVSYMIGNYIEDHWEKWAEKLLEKGTEVSFGDILETDAQVLLMVWDIASDYIPILKDGLDSTENFELALYAERIQAEALKMMIEVKDKISSDGKMNEDYLYQLAQTYYIYLKACMITRNAAVASLASKKYMLGEDVIGEIERYESEINQEIADYLIIMKKAQLDKKGNLDNSNMAFGFLPSDNKEYLKRYDDKKLIGLIDTEKPTDTGAEWPDEFAQSIAYERYRRLILEYEDKYGAVGMDKANEMRTYLTGLCFAKLVDFNQDGQEELLIVYSVKNLQADFLRYDYTFEIWEFRNNDIAMVDTGSLYGTDAGVKTVRLVHYNGRTYLLTGDADDFEYNYYHGYKNTEFGIVREALSDNYLDKWTIDGQAVQRDQWIREEELWQENIEYYSLNYDFKQAQTARVVLESTKAILDIVETSLSMDSQILYDDWNSAYYDILLQYYNVINNDKITIQDRSDLDIVNYIFYYRYDEDYQGSFAITDIDNNGIPELLIGSTDDIRDIYTWQNGEVIRLLSRPGERANLKLCEGGILYEISSGGAASNYQRYFKLREDGKSCYLYEYYHIEGDSQNENADITVEKVDGSIETFLKEDFHYDIYDQKYPLSSLECESLSIENIENKTGISKKKNTLITEKSIVQAPYFRMGLCENFINVINNYYLRVAPYEINENSFIPWDYTILENGELVEFSVKDTHTKELKFIGTFNRRTCDINGNLL